MGKVILYIATSIDGYIARADGGLDWLDSVQIEGEDYGYHGFYDSVDALIMGSATYEQILNFGAWPYPGKPSYIMTQRELHTDRDDIIITDQPPQAVVAAARAAGNNNIWLVGGGALTVAFLNNNLIDEMIISIIPMTLGSGVPLFPAAQSIPQREFDLTDVQKFSSGLAQLTYVRREKE